MEKYYLISAHDFLPKIVEIHAKLLYVNLSIFLQLCSEYFLQWCHIIFNSYDPHNLWCSHKFDSLSFRNSKNKLNFFAKFCRCVLWQHKNKRIWPQLKICIQKRNQFVYYNAYTYSWIVHPIPYSIIKAQDTETERIFFSHHN